MSIRTWWNARRTRRRREQAAAAAAHESPLREFVYLDAMSLQSLLVSQNMTLLESVSQAVGASKETETSTSLSADALVGKGEVTARFQTSNSTSQESSRKAIIQSLFKEFRELPLEFKLAKHDTLPKPVENVSSIPDVGNSRVVELSDSFKRGDLVEIEVRLAVDPVFKLAAMVTEWSAMADEYPQMFKSNPGTLGFLRDSEPIMKVLERFLAGLIPIRATAVNHVVIEVMGKKYIADKRAVRDLGLDMEPLYIVGVTEQQSYWRDIRRVLFNAGEFKILGRIARDGLQEKWTPVKLADLFSDVAPDFVDKINAIRSPTASNISSPSLPHPRREASFAALRYYQEELLAYTERVDSSSRSEEDGSYFEGLIPSGTDELSSAEQRRAFDQTRDRVFAGVSELPLTAEEDLAARQRARQRASEELLAAANPGESQAPRQQLPNEPTQNQQLLDVEVIAIYW